MSNTNENTTILEYKAEARRLKACLSEMSITLPHKTALRAIARIHEFKNWEVLVSSLAEKQKDQKSSYVDIFVTGEIYSDDHRVTETFNAAPWLASASLDDLKTLSDEGWGNDEVSDDIGREHSSGKVLDYIQFIPDLGFTCHVNSTEALRWLLVNNYPLHALLWCHKNEISLLEAKEPEFKGMWAWTDHRGDSCVPVYASEEEAAIGAYQRRNEKLAVPYLPYFDEKRAVATDAFDAYDFGEGVTVVGASSWDISEENDWIRVTYVVFNDTDNSVEPTSDKVSFHVRFKDSSADLEEAYALLVSSGGAIGTYPHE